MIYNAKLADDKKRDGGGAKKGKLKPKINAGKAVDAIGTRNNNTAMVADLVGSDDEDYGEYGEEYPVTGSHSTFNKHMATSPSQSTIQMRFSIPDKLTMPSVGFLLNTNLKTN